VLVVRVGRCRGVGRTEEHEALTQVHASLAVLDEWRDLVEQLVEQLVVARHLLDVLEHHPAAVGLDPAGDLAG